MDDTRANSPTMPGQVGPVRPAQPPPAAPPGVSAPPRPAAGPAAPPISAPQSSKIQHTPPGFGRASVAAEGVAAPPAQPPADPTLHPLPVANPAAAQAPGAKITQFGKGKRHEDDWSRTPSTGTGAIHVKTFHCKLTEDALTYMDQAINEWLDAHPQYDVKFVSSTIGTFTGKLKEPALICQVWV